MKQLMTKLFVVMMMVFTVVVGLDSARVEAEVNGEEPFSVLMLGVDTGEYGRSDAGRSDIIVVATVNPASGTTLMTSIPRDTYTEIIGMGYNDKINHAYAFGGTEMAEESVANLLNIPIDQTIAVDMGGFIELVDSVGGITVVPNTSFEINGYYFEGGVPTFVDGEGALSYVRERYTSGGDGARQARAQEVIQQIIQEGLNPSNASNLPTFLKVAEQYIELDIGLSELGVLAESFGTISESSENVPLSGYGEMIDGIYYEIIDAGSLEAAQEAHRSNLGL